MAKSNYYESLQTSTGSGYITLPSPSGVRGRFGSFNVAHFSGDTSQKIRTRKGLCLSDFTFLLFMRIEGSAKFHYEYRIVPVMRIEVTSIFRHFMSIECASNTAPNAKTGGGAYHKKWAYTYSQKNQSGATEKQHVYTETQRQGGEARGIEYKEYIQRNTPHGRTSVTLGKGSRGGEGGARQWRRGSGGGEEDIGNTAEHAKIEAGPLPPSSSAV